MFKAALRSLLARRMRLLLTGLAIVLGVGFMAGTYVLTDTMTRAFNEIIETGAAEVDVLIRSESAYQAMTNGGMEERKPLSEWTLPVVRRVPGVARAVGDVLGYAQVVDPATGEPIGTLGPPTAASSWNEVNGYTILRGGRPPEGPDEVVLDASTAEGHDIEVGDRVQILFQGPPGEFEVVGIARYGESDSLLGATWALFDLPTAQRVLGREAQLDSIMVVAEEGVSPIELTRRISEVLPEDAEAVTAAAVAAEQQQMVEEGLGFFRTALLVFALVALFVGAFIIFNTFAIIVAQRTRELALLRALGANRRQVMTSVILEAVVVGLVASTLGVVAGIGIAIGLKALLAATGFDIPAAGTVIQVRTFVVSIVVGTLVTLVAAVVPARRAASVAPVEALREAQDTPGRSLRFRLISGAVVLVAGVTPVLYGLFGQPDNALQLAGIGIAVTFIGLAMLTPMIAGPVARVLGAPVRGTGVSGRLGRENAMRNPRRTAATASALMIGLGLVVFVAVFGASARASVDSALDRTLRADFVLTSPTFSGFSPAAATRMRQVPGVEHVSELRQQGFRVGGESAFLTAVDPGSFPSVAEAGVVGGSIGSLSLPDTIAVHEDEAADNGWTLGDRVEAEFAATGERELQIVAIYSEDGILGNYAISLGTYRAHFSQQLDLMVFVAAEPGADVAAVQRGLEEALAEFPNIDVQDQAAFREKYAQFLNQVLNLLTALLLMAVIIAVFGIVNTLSLSIYERTRELGLLRAVGMTRRQTRSMVRWEAVLIAVMGALFGVVVGIAFGWIMQRALAPEGFTELGIPGVQIAIYVVLAGVAGVLAAILPARRAARLNVLQAIAYE
ncbi:MAG TPA: ABC transporter permease [Actinomycetota bacterium]